MPCFKIITLCQNKPEIELFLQKPTKFLVYQFVKEGTQILPFATSHIPHLCNQFNHVFALLISMPRFERINSYQNSPKKTFER